MSCILDIDLDYFNLIENPEKRLRELLDWGNRRIAFIVEKQHKTFSRWEYRVKRGTLTPPSHILHVDEHHDMMDQKRNTNIANFMYHAMRTWKSSRVHWMVHHQIDSPEMWLGDDVRELFSQRFTVGSNCPHGWPKPDIVSEFTSRNFVSNKLLQRLLETAKEFMTTKQRTEMEKLKCRTSRSG
ncbi:MAG: hypothetical protein B1H12_03495 [Desulfobacteraceae bacterium 4484_190.2]|nr:MAG: hypothetical protein B1H12_03495 [Desulfobacteraceae bacterium 4484_190.2]